MVLLNAVYFYGSWTYEFEEKGTRIRSFTNLTALK